MVAFIGWQPQLHGPPVCGKLDQLLWQAREHHPDRGVSHPDPEGLHQAGPLWSGQLQGRAPPQAVQGREGELPPARPGQWKLVQRAGDTPEQVMTCTHAHARAHHSHANVQYNYVHT